MRKVAVISLALLAFALVACGGGSSSSGSATTSGGTTGNSASGGPEAAWAKELRSVMSQFENKVSAEAVEKINTTTAQVLLEPLFRVYGTNLATFAAKLEATKAPKACVALRKKIAGYAHTVSRLTSELGDQQKLSEEKYGHLVISQREKISKYGTKLTTLAAEPNC